MLSAVTMTGNASAPGARPTEPRSSPPAPSRVSGERFVATEVTGPDEYARLFALAERVFAGYGTTVPRQCYRA